MISGYVFSPPFFCVLSWPKINTQWTALFLFPFFQLQSRFLEIPHKSLASSFVFCVVIIFCINSQISDFNPQILSFHPIPQKFNRPQIYSSILVWISISQICVSNCGLFSFDLCHCNVFGNKWMRWNLNQFPRIAQYIIKNLSLGAIIIYIFIITCFSPLSTVYYLWAFLDISSLAVGSIWNVSLIFPTFACNSYVSSFLTLGSIIECLI